MRHSSPTFRPPPQALVLAAAAMGWVATWALSPASAATLTRGPYLQVGTSTSVTVRWSTDVATDSRVKCGLSTSALTTIIDNSTSTTTHSITMTGLSPETRYYYSVGSLTQALGGGTSEYTFKTSPAPGASRATRIWVIGDSGQPGSSQLAVKNAFKRWTGSRDADVWLMLGDNAYDSGTDAQYQAGCFEPYSELLRKIVLWPTRGNHDQVGSSIDYYDIFTMPTSAQAGGVPSGTEAYYSFDYANIHFICLDSEGSSRSKTGAMASWLKNDLAATQRNWVIAYWHHPPYSHGSHNSDTDSQMTEMRTNLVPILESGGVDLALTGHSHDYERTYLLNGHYGTSSTLTSAMILDHGNGSTASGGDGAYQKPLGLAANQGAVYAVAGSSSKTSSGSLDHPAMVVSLLRLGSMVIDVDGNNLTARFLDSGGTVRDNFTISKHAVTGVETPQPLTTSLSIGARPNPVKRTGTSIEYVLPASGHVNLAVYGVDGRRVAQLVDKEVEAGPHSIRWGGHDQPGSAVAPGVYFAAIEWGGQVRVQRLVKLQ